MPGPAVSRALARLVPLAALTLLAACASAGAMTDTPSPAAAAPAAATLDDAARDYVVLSLMIGQKEDGYIDAYYGPADLKEKALAEAPSQDLAALEARAEGLRNRIGVIGRQIKNAEQAMRVRYLEGQLTAAITRLRMMKGEKLSFEEEARGLFGVTPDLVDLKTLDPVLAKIDALVPGEGDLPDRVDAFEAKLDIAPEYLTPVMDAAIAECRRRTMQHIALPAAEHFDLGLVTDKPWGGYNYYLGDYHSRIEINTDLPVQLSRAIDLGCHEGYPGHHVYNALLEQKLVRGKGWIEFTVYPLYSPQSLIAEGSANYGIDLAFPGDEAAAFDAGLLAPIAHLPPGLVKTYAELQKAKQALSGARIAIAAQYLDGRIDRAEAIRLLEKYNVTSEKRAAKSLQFIDHYRSYMLNYGYGQDLVKHAVEAAGPGEDARWARMERILSEPTVPADLVAMAGGASG